MSKTFAVPRNGNGTGNRILRAIGTLEPTALETLTADLRTVSVPRGTVLAAAGEVPTRVLFIDSGVASAIAETAAGHSVELGFVGAEGISPVGWLLGGSPPPFSFVAQFSLTAREIDAARVRRLLAQDGHHPLHCLIQMYGQFVIGQLAQSTVCARFHTATERLARWLLLTATSIASNTLPLTHEAVSHMVGAPRSQVTDAVGELRRSGSVASARGTIEILSRHQLRMHACECFAVDRARLQAFERRLAPNGNGPDRRQAGGASERSSGTRRSR